MGLSAGARLGPYEVLAPLGAGGMGEVWKARDTRLDREVAVKVLPASFAGDVDALARFDREAKAVAALSHPNILAIHDLGEATGVHYAVMELLEGRTLGDRLRAGPISVKEAVGFALQIARGLSAAHEKGIVHRDLKPENIFIGRDGHLKILDFGLARWSHPLSGTDTNLPTASVHTVPGTVIGTVGYMSPEQVRGLPVDHRSDLFSFGAILYEMLSGRRVFKGDSVADTLSSILHDEPRDFGETPVPERLREIVRKLLEKDAGRRYAKAEEAVADLKEFEESQVPSRHRLSRGTRIALAGAIVVVATLAGWLFLRDRRIRRARQELLPRAERLLGEAKWLGDCRAAFALAVEAEKVVPDDPRLAPLLERVSATTSFTSEPPGAVVSIKPYDDPKAPWESLGVAPIQSVRLPASVFLVRFEKPGYEPVMAAARTFTWDLAARVYRPTDIRRVLDRSGTLPPGMVRVTGLPNLPDYFIDATEVTNKTYKEFVDAGGYRTKEYWKDLLSPEDKSRSWPDAIVGFVDETGRPGPATWQAGDFPAGRDQYPVSGVSWYEAAAFAAWAGKSLPSSTHWEAARGGDVPPTLTATMSNFRGVGPVPVGSLPSLSAFGAYDMAGNVREWCWNVAPEGRVVRGGAWNDVSYMASSVSRASPFDRSPKNGFRCVKYLDRATVPVSAFEPVKQNLDRPDFYKIHRVPEAVFRVYRERFNYDRSELGATVEWRNTASRDWVQEKVTFNAAYDGERMAAYLFLPTRGSPPYQTVVYFPGSGSINQRSSKDLETYREFEMFLGHFLKSGRAVVYPLYKGTFERGSDALEKLLYAKNDATHQYTELFVKIVKDLRRTLDYLETRTELDHVRVAYLGFSWGGEYGAIIPAVEERLKASMLVVGGLDSGFLPEVDPINYVGRVKIPTLMLNGRYDFRFPYESSARPMYDLLGTPSDQKTQKLYDTDHGVPRNELVKETLSWLDRFLGAVQ